MSDGTESALNSWIAGIAFDPFWISSRIFNPLEVDVPITQSDLSMGGQN